MSNQNFKLMKYLSLIAIFLFGNSIIAQITVVNDGFITANNIVVFSNDYVNLKNTDSKFYLRNEAQLIQGNGTTGNSGIGELSVQQTGIANQYAYQYWCSPVGNIDADVFGNSPARVNLIDESTGFVTSTDAGFTTGYNGSTSPLVISSRWLYTYEAGTSYLDWNFVGSTGAIPAGQGFTEKGNDSQNQMYDFRGKSNNGTITNTVALDALTLVGNPYPSALDARDFIHDANNSTTIDGCIYLWEQGAGADSHFVADYIGGYACYTINAAGTMETFTPATFDTYDSAGNPQSAPPSPGTGVRTAGRYFPIAQGFMVKGKANGTVRTTNAMREYHKVSEGNSFFFRSSSDTQTSNNQTNEFGYNNVPDGFGRLRVNVTFNNTFNRQLLINFHNEVSNDDFNYGLETRTPRVLSSDAYWTLSANDDVSELYTAKAYKYAEELEMPLYLTLNDNQSVKFNPPFDVQNFDTSQKFFLLDKEYRTYTDITTQGHEITLPAGEYSNRFFITFIDAQALGNDEFTINSLDVFHNDGLAQLTILNPKGMNLKSVSLFDITSKEVLHEELSNQSKYSFSTKALASGVYIVNVKSQDGELTTEKLIISN